jgi:hypothetical protein
VKGVYVNFSDAKTSTYPLLYIPSNNPDCEFWAIDAYECNAKGVINPAKRTAQPHVASDFGKFIGEFLC